MRWKVRAPCRSQRRRARLRGRDGGRLRRQAPAARPRSPRPDTARRLELLARPARSGTSAAMRMSQHSTSMRPPAMACPLTAATTSRGNEKTARNARFNASISGSCKSGPLPWMASRSRPAQNDRPSPVSTTPRSESSERSWSKTPASSVRLATSMTFAGGRASITTATSSSRLKRTKGMSTVWRYDGRRPVTDGVSRRRGGDDRAAQTAVRRSMP